MNRQLRATVWAIVFVAACFPLTNIISAYSTAARVRQMQLDDGVSDTISPVVALLLGWNIAIGIAVGVALGVVFGSAVDINRSNQAK